MAVSRTCTWHNKLQHMMKSESLNKSRPASPKTAMSQKAGTSLFYLRHCGGTCVDPAIARIRACGGGGLGRAAAGDRTEAAVIRYPDDAAALARCASPPRAQ